MKAETVSKEQATSEVNDWLDFKKVSEKKRETPESKANIDALVNAIMEGDLILKEDKTFVYTLKFATEGDSPIRALEFKPRLKMLDIHSKLEGVKSSDGDGRVLAYVSALTGKAKQIIRNLDSEDYNIPQAIAIFFL